MAYMNRNFNRQLGNFSYSQKIDSDKLRDKYRSFSGADIIPVAYAAGQLKILGNIQVLSISTHRDIVPVRAFGYTLPKGTVRNMQTNAGTLVFSAFDYGILSDLTGLYQQDYIYDSRMKSVDLSTIPAFDIIITCSNEYGSMAYSRVFRVEIPDSSLTFGVDQLVPEGTVQFMCGPIDHLTPIFEEGPDVSLNDTIFYGRYDLNAMKTANGKYVSDAMATIRRLQRIKVGMMNKQGQAASNMYSVMTEEEARVAQFDYMEIDNKIKDIYDSLNILNDYQDIDMSQILQQDTSLSRIIDTGVEIYHDTGNLINFGVADFYNDRVDELYRKYVERKVDPDSIERQEMADKLIPTNKIQTSPGYDVTVTDNAIYTQFNGPPEELKPIGVRKPDERYVPPEFREQDTIDLEDSFKEVRDNINDNPTGIETLIETPGRTSSDGTEDESDVESGG